MVRNFPRTTRSRALAALAVGSLLLGVAVVPLAAADDLKDKKHKVERQIAGASDDLDESSAQARRAASALAAAKVRLDAAQAQLAQTRGELAAAEVLDQQMQAKLDAAVARLDQARADLVAGRKKIADQQKTLGEIVVQNYQTGDPSLMGLSMVLTSQDPAELTGQLNSVQNVLDKESVTLDRLEASRALLTVQEQEVEDAKVEVAKERKAAAENLLRKQGLEAQAEAAEQQVTSLVVAARGRPAGGRQGQARPTWPSCTACRRSAPGSPRSSRSAPTRPVAVRRPRPAAPVTPAARSCPTTGPRTPTASWTTRSSAR